MQRIFKIHKTFEEMEQYDIALRQQTTAIQRFRNLYYMQNFTKKVHGNKNVNRTRTITITHGYPPY